MSRGQNQGTVTNQSKIRIHPSKGLRSFLCLLGTSWVEFAYAPIFGGHLMVLQSPKCWIFCCNWAVLSPTTSHRLSSWFQTSIYLHEPISPGPSIITEVVPSPKYPQIIYNILGETLNKQLKIFKKETKEDKFCFKKTILFSHLWCLKALLCIVVWAAIDGPLVSALRLSMTFSVIESSLRNQL